MSDDDTPVLLPLPEGEDITDAEHLLTVTRSDDERVVITVSVGAFRLDGDPWLLLAEVDGTDPDELMVSTIAMPGDQWATVFDAFTEWMDRR